MVAPSGCGFNYFFFINLYSFLGWRDAETGCKGWDWPSYQHSDSGSSVYIALA